MPQISPSQMIQDFLKINDPSLFSVTQRKDGGFNVSGKIFNDSDKKPTIDFQKIWYIANALSANHPEFKIEAGRSRSKIEYKLIIPQQCLPKIDSKEEQALYQIKVLCVHYLIHVYEVADERIRTYNQELDKQKLELHSKLNICIQVMKKYPPKSAEKITNFYWNQSECSSKDLKDLGPKYITDVCSQERIPHINQHISSSGLGSKKSAFCQMFHAQTIVEVAKIIESHKWRLRSFRNTEIEKHYDCLEYLKIMAIVLTFPITLPILAAISYKNRGSFCFYKPDSELCVEKIQEQINYVPNKV